MQHVIGDAFYDHPNSDRAASTACLPDELSLGRLSNPIASSCTSSASRTTRTLGDYTLTSSSNHAGVRSSSRTTSTLDYATSGTYTVEDDSIVLEFTATGNAG